ncbi:hypothetical protein ACFLR4_00480 [Bacteroidota bacterium]
MQYIETLRSNQDIFFNFMKEKYPVYTNSNIFHKDILYAIRSFFEKKNSQLSYSIAENLTRQFTEYLENKGDLVKLDKNSWKVNFSFKNSVEE